MSIILLFESTPVFYAANSIQFTCKDAETARNRLVKIDVEADYTGKLSAAYFEFTYDKTMFEYRCVTSADKSSRVSANEESEKLNVVFLNAKGKSLNSKSVIFTVTLKAINGGSSYLDYTVEDCVDEKVKSISVGKCTSAKINVSGRHDDVSSKKIDSSDKNNSSSKSGKSNGKSTRNQNTTTTPSSNDELGLLNPFDNHNLTFFVIGTASACILAGIIYIAFKIGKQSSKNKKDK